MTQEDFTEAVRYLNGLSEGDYHQSLQEVYSEEDDTLVATKIGRLVGVAIKLPFAIQKDRQTPSQFSSSYREYNLLPYERLTEILEDQDVKNTWQYRTLELMNANNPNASTIASLMMDAHYERGFWGYLGKSFVNYICNNGPIRERIKTDLENARQEGYAAKVVDPEILVAIGGLSLGNYLISIHPDLSALGAPVIAGIVMVLYRIGIDGFCPYMDKYFEVREGESEKK